MKHVDSQLLADLRTPPLRDPMLTSAPNIKWGILATGGIASLFVRQVLSAGGDIHAVASRSKEKAKEFVRLYGSGRYGVEHGQISGASAVEGVAKIKKAYGSYDELFKDPEIDAIYIATPHSDHHEWALKAIENGKPILIEKAITQNKKQAEEIFELAKKKGVFVMEAMWTRFLPHMREIKEIVESGKIGEIVAVNANFGIKKDYNPEHRLFAPELAGGALLDLGVYPISFAHYILGKPSKIISSAFAAPTGVDANLAVILEYNNGAQAICHTTSLAFTSSTAVISGTKGRIEIDGPFYRPTNFTLKMNSEEKLRYTNKIETPELFGDDGRYGMHFEAAEVARCLSDGLIESPIMSWQNSLDVMQTMDTIRAQNDFKLPGE